MSGTGGIRQGMRIYAADGQLLGTVERVSGDGLVVAGRAIPASAIARVTADTVHLSRTYAESMGTATGALGTAAGVTTTTAITGQITVPVAEERLNVQKREAEVGEVEIRKTVEQEQVSVPVELRREEIRVEQRDLDDRPVQAGDNVFQEGVMRIPVSAEEAVVTKEAVVTGEIVLDKEQRVERHMVTEMVRKERVEVEEGHAIGRAEGTGTTVSGGTGTGGTITHGSVGETTSAAAGAEPDGFAAELAGEETMEDDLPPKAGTTSG